MIIDVEGTETGWKITALGIASEYPFTARLKRCTMPHWMKQKKIVCDGKHEREVAIFVKKLRATYEASERLFR